MRFIVPKGLRLTQQDCNYQIGIIRHEELKKAFTNLGYTVKIFAITSNDVDLKIFKNGKFIAVIESMNWDYNTRIDADRIKSPINNFKKYADLKRFLVINFKANLRNFETMITPYARVVYIEFQSIPDLLYQAAKRQGTTSIHHRRSDNSTIRDITSIINNQIVPYI
jgi:hypothetical protein